jgi:hypothetical protein
MATVSEPEVKIPPLRQGDRLTVEEFDRRYQAMPELKKAELIEGVVYMPSPVTIEDHGNPHACLIGWLVWYQAFTPGTQAGDNSTLRLSVGVNRPQPDALLRVLPDYGGQSQTSEDGYVVSGPELVGEIAASRAAYDLHDKLETYLRNGIREYVVWRVEEKAIDWYVNRKGKYEKLAPNSEGLFLSPTFPGLWLDAPALVRSDLVRVLQVLQQGIATKEHQEFVEKLNKSKIALKA